MPKKKKKCCVRWMYPKCYGIIITIIHYKYQFDKIKYCPECGTNMEV